LIWSLYGDDSLHARIEAAFNLLWSGLMPRPADTNGLGTSLTSKRKARRVVS
jgi:hypothetical protein